MAGRSRPGKGMFVTKNEYGQRSRTNTRVVLHINVFISKSNHTLFAIYSTLYTLHSFVHHQDHVKKTYIPEEREQLQII